MEPYCLTSGVVADVPRMRNHISLSVRLMTILMGNVASTYGLKKHLESLRRLANADETEVFDILPTRVTI